MWCYVFADAALDHGPESIASTHPSGLLNLLGAALRVGVRDPDVGERDLCLVCGGSNGVSEGGVTHWILCWWCWVCEGGGV